jgi:hypothetical protein
MTTVQRQDGWWITDCPDCEDCGPYSTRAEAESDMRGLARFEKYADRPGYVTTDRRECHEH